MITPTERCPSMFLCRKCDCVYCRVFHIGAGFRPQRYVGAGGPGPASFAPRPLPERLTLSEGQTLSVKSRM